MMTYILRRCFKRVHVREDEQIITFGFYVLHSINIFWNHGCGKREPSRHHKDNVVDVLHHYLVNVTFLMILIIWM